MILDNKYALAAVIGVHCALFYQLSQLQRPSAPAEPVFMQAMPLAMGQSQAELQVQEQKPLPKVKQKIKQVRQKVQERVAKTQQTKTALAQPETPERAATLEVAVAKSTAQRDEPMRGEAKSSNDTAAVPSGGQEGQSKQAEPILSAPSFHANYLSNPKPPYPPASLALGEQGIVYLRVLVSPAGVPEKIELHKSSGFARLDAVAQSTVQRWRFVPAKRGDEAVAGSVVVPVNFSIKKS